MKGLFIINPSSGRQNFIDKIKEMAGMLVIDQICNTIDVFYTEKQDDALNLSLIHIFYIGEGVKQEDIKAAFKNGILSITVPKEDKTAKEAKKYITIGE